MASSNQYKKSKKQPWHKVYLHLGNLLKEFSDSHPIDPGKALFELLINDLEFQSVNDWARNFTQEWAKESIDPIQIFASITGSRQNEKTRRKRINVLVEKLSQKKDFYGLIDYHGCPQPRTVKLVASRELDSQREIWDVFKAVKKDGLAGLKPRYWKSAKNWYGVAHPSFTIFLFWVRPDQFLPMDSLTRSYLEGYQKLPKNPFSFEAYTKLCNDIISLSIDKEKFTAFLDITRIAFETSQGAESHLSSELKRFLGDKIIQFDPGESKLIPLVDDLLKADFQKVQISERLIRAARPRQVTPIRSGQFRLIALQTFEKNYVPIIGKLYPHLKALKPGAVYNFDKSFQFSEESTQKIRFLPKKNLSFYPQSGLGPQLNLHAIVGENGSGKSTLVEILLKIFNEVARRFEKQISNNVFGTQENFKVSLFFHDSRGLHRLDVDTSQKKRNQLKIFDYTWDAKDMIFLEGEESNFLKQRLRNFFYSILVNYSHFSFSEARHNHWLYPIFEKNDGYQAPVAISPYRKDGNIEMYRENQLATTRLLGILFEPEEQIENEKDDDEESQPVEERFKSIRKITNNLTAVQVNFTFERNDNQGTPKNQDKAHIKAANAIKQGNHWEDILKEIFEVFGGLNQPQIPENELVKAAKDYMIRKLVKIVTYYSPYKEKYFNKDNSTVRIELLQSLLEDLYKDHSHITTKFRQAVNFLRFPLLKKFGFFEEKKSQFILNIESYSKEINGFRSRQNGFTPEIEPEIPAEELIPPPIFKPLIFLSEKPNQKEQSFEDLINFQELSSGEKQRIYTVGTIIYHLRNLNSVLGKGKMVKYQNINLILDEIELYYHPEYQRTFISYLLSMIQRMEYDNFFGLNIMFITHSPYILSDIPDTYVLKLKAGVPDSDDKEGIKTLGANIHDLLRQNFFMENGVMGEFAQKQIGDLIEYLLAQKEKRTTEGYFWNKDKAKQVIELIGEQLLRTELIKLYDEAFSEQVRLQEIEANLKRLEAEKEKILNSFSDEKNSSL